MIEQSSPGVRLLVNQMSKERMIIICKDNGLDTTGTRLELAKRITKWRSDEFNKLWKVLVSHPM